MGAFTPSPLVDDATERARIRLEIVEPVLAGMRKEGHPYTGFLYCGLMLTADGPMVIEFNARLGDPEAQVLLPLGEPLLPLLQAAASGRSRHGTLACQPSAGSASSWPPVAIPRRSKRDIRLAVLPKPPRCADVRVYHAGTRRSDEGIVTSGGRVLTVVGSGADFPRAIARAYAGVDTIRFEGAFARRDIGRKAVRS